MIWCDNRHRLRYRVKSAKKYLGEHKRLENAIDAYYNNGEESSSSRATPNGADPATITPRLNQIYDTYKGSFSGFHLRVPLILLIDRS